MSKIAKKPIVIDPEITVKIDKRIVSVAGVKGTLELKLPEGINVEISGQELTVVNPRNSDTNMVGLYRSLLHNAVKGVKSEWTKTLELVGVGYRAQMSGSDLTLHLGFSHPVIIPAPYGITFRIQDNKITVIGVDKYLVGEVAAKIRKLKKPEPYKGKGIRYEGEHIRKKIGKAAKVVGGAAVK